METPESKKPNLEALSKEELIKKCKSLITLAQKAKTCKETLQQENTELKKQLNTHSDNNPSNELLEKLTEEKLALVTEIDSLKSSNKNYREKLNQLETENISFSRQAKRLTDENEQLISDLSTLEAQISELHNLGLQQKSQLLELEKSHSELQSRLSCSLNEVEKANVHLKLKDKEILELSQELQALKIVKKSNINVCDSSSDNKEIDDLKSNNDKLKDKVLLYHSKLKKFALVIREIKNEKNQIIELFKDCNLQMKEQLLKASKDLLQLMKKQAEEKKIYLVDIEKLNEDVKLKQKFIEEIELENSQQQKQLELLNEEINLKQKLIDELEEASKINVDKLNEAYKKMAANEDDHNQEKLENDLKMIKEQQNKELKEINEKHDVEINKLKEELEKYKAENARKQQEENDFEAVINELKTELKSKQETLKNTENDFKMLQETYEKKLNEAEEELEKYKNNNIIKQEKDEELRGKITKLEEELKLKQEVFDETLKNTKKDFEKLQETFEEKFKEVKEELEKSKESNARKACENEELTAKIIKLKEELEVSEENNENNFRKLQETYEEKLNKAEQELETYKKEAEDARKQQEESENEFKAKIHEIAELNGEVGWLNEEIKLKQKLVDEALENEKKIKETYEGKLNEAKIDAESMRKQMVEQIEAKIIEENSNNKQQLANEVLVKMETENTKLKETLKEYELKLEKAQKSSEETNKLNEASKQSEQKLTEKSSEEIIRLVLTNKDLQEKYSKLEEDINKTKNKMYQQNCTQTDEIEDKETTQEDKGIDLKRENSEMLLEMNQMNQALKERGETISKLEAHCEEIKKKLQLYETQANKNVDSISEKEKTIKALSTELDSLHNNSEIADLKAEIEQLKEKLNYNENYAESEAMSTSTISKTEEANRLKDLEGSWEERYGKLRTLAVKLKAKIKEQANSINELEKEREELFKKHQTSIKTIQSLQKQLDNLQDDLDKTNKDNKQYITKLNSVAESISKDKQLLVQNEDTISKLNKEIDNFNKDKQATENWKKQVGAKVQTLRKELEAKNLLIKDFESQINKLENEISNKDNQLKQEQENHKQTKNLLEQTNGEIKKNSVLNLEMQDYEKSVKELSQKIEKQKNEIGNLQTQVDMQKNTVNALREQNKTLEERIEEVQKSGSSSNLEVNSCKKTIKNLEEILQQKDDKLTNSNKLLETARSENEELSTELSKVIAEHQKSLNTIKNERDQLRSQLLSVQQNLRDTQNTLKLREEELKGIKEEYETYKVRAQSVLKKNQGRDLGLEEKLSEEVATIKTQNDKLNEELKEIRHKLQQVEIAKENLLKERDNLQKKSKDLENEVEELKSHTEQLGLKHQKAISEHAETIRNLKVHAETLSQCYRQQLTEQETRHNREIIELQSRIDKAPSPIEPTVHPNMPREEGEGSESVESNPRPNNVHPIPLERLLDSKSDDEVNYLKKQISEQESKLVHLTALLSDTEQDLAKHVQMNKVLKEEIRRQQRSVEREQHAENLEYLKNVVFKFVTLTAGDERTRLVPVLNTILKLSPDETQKLQMVAKGDPGIKAWASYLPTWSSANKPQ